MNTAAISTLLGSSSSAQAWFEVKLIEDALPTTILSKQVSVQAAVIKDGGVIVPAGLTPLSVEAANVIYLQREISGPIYLIDPDTGGKLRVWNNAGTLQADEVE
jgi:hypothetical protein